MKKNNKGQLLFGAILVILITFNVLVFRQYENVQLRGFIILNYGTALLFGLVLATRLNYWVLCIITCLLMCSIPLMEALVFLPNLHKTDTRTALVLYGNEGIFTTSGTMTITLFGFIIPLILVGIKGTTTISHCMRKTS